jgi:hypothetical protein
MRSPTNGGSTHRWIRSNILGLVAIFIALSGSAVAANVASDGGDANSAAKKKGKKKGKPGPQGPQGPQGPPGAPGSAVAFAHVNANGTLDAANSKNIVSSTGTGADGYYCVTPSVPVRSMVATADSSSGGGNFDASASFTDNLTACPDGAVVVTTYGNAAASGTADFPVWVVFN